MWTVVEGNWRRTHVLIIMVGTKSNGCVNTVETYGALSVPK